MSKDYELLKKEVEFIESCEMTCEIGAHAAFKNIYECAERMAAELAAKDKRIADLCARNSAYIKFNENAETIISELREDLAAKDKQISKMTNRLVDIGQLKDEIKMLKEALEKTRGERDRARDNGAAKDKEIERLKKENTMCDDFRCTSKKLCDQCKHYYMSRCNYHNAHGIHEFTSCPNSARPDGKRPCCAECRYLKGPNSANCVECWQEQFDYMSANNINTNSMSCPMHEWREA